MNLIKDISEYSGYRPSGGDLLKLFQLAIVENINRQDAVKFFSSSSYFRKIYKQLKDRLLDGILLNSFEELTKVQQSQFTIRKRALESIMLLYTEKKEAGIKIIEETFFSAIKYGMSDVALSMGKELVIHYSVISPNKQKRDRFITATEFLFKKAKEEWRAQSLFADLAFCIQQKNSINNIESAFNELHEIAEENKEYKFRLYYYSFLNLYNRFTNNQDAIIQTCKEAISFFKSSKTLLPYTTSWNFKFQMIPVYLHKKQYADTSAIIQDCLRLPTKGSYNWHLTLLYKVVLGFYSEKPAIALQAWKTIQKTPRKFHSEVIENRWSIIYGYLALFQRTGNLHFPNSWKTRKNLNDTRTPVTGKVNLIILELLHLLLDGKKKAYMNRVENIEGYIRDNLRNKPRPKYFLRMLRAVELGDYNAIRVQAHAKKHYDLLKRTTNTININVLDTEPVPFEMLWEMVLERLYK